MSGFIIQVEDKVAHQIVANSLSDLGFGETECLPSSSNWLACVVAEVTRMQSDLSNRMGTQAAFVGVVEVEWNGIKLVFGVDSDKSINRIWRTFALLVCL